MNLLTSILTNNQNQPTEGTPPVSDYFYEFAIYLYHQQGPTGSKEILDSYFNGTPLKKARIEKMQNNIPKTMKGKNFSTRNWVDSWVERWGQMREDYNSGKLEKIIKSDWAPVKDKARALERSQGLREGFYTIVSYQESGGDDKKVNKLKDGSNSKHRGMFQLNKEEVPESIYFDPIRSLEYVSKIFNNSIKAAEKYKNIDIEATNDYEYGSSDGYNYSEMGIPNPNIPGGAAAFAKEMLRRGMDDEITNIFERLDKEHRDEILAYYEFENKRQERIKAEEKEKKEEEEKAYAARVAETEKVRNEATQVAAMEMQEHQRLEAQRQELFDQMQGAAMAQSEPFRYQNNWMDFSGSGERQAQDGGVITALDKLHSLMRENKNATT